VVLRRIVAAGGDAFGVVLGACHAHAGARQPARDGGIGDGVLHARVIEHERDALRGQVRIERQIGAAALRTASHAIAMSTQRPRATATTAPRPTPCAWSSRARRFAAASRPA